jgi:hypothetical protein
MSDSTTKVIWGLPKPRLAQDGVLFV